MGLLPQRPSFVFNQHKDNAFLGLSLYFFVNKTFNSQVYYKTLKNDWGLSDIPEPNLYFAQDIVDLSQLKLVRLRNESSINETDGKMINDIESFFSEVLKGV